MVDKRSAYRRVRIPMMAHCPELIPASTTVKQMVANIDIAATIAGGGRPGGSAIDGRP